ncbi:MAG: acetolactate decarboxylase [Clostridia bacterium]|nr:acetolactate decarboxylase [Clostridia bacterium]
MKKLISFLLASLLFIGMAFASETAPDKETLFQVALLQSLAQGYFDGVVTVGDLKNRGDTGIGTFDALNGEMIVLDGVVYRALEDGSIEIPQDSETVPYAAVTFLDTDETLTLSGVGNMDALQALLNDAVSARGRNLFCMALITGVFPMIRVRSEAGQEKPYGELAGVLAAGQKEYVLENARGAMVGLFCPDYMRGLNSPGWHFHFITDARTAGGHVLQVRIGEAEAVLDMTNGFAMLLPEDPAFHGLDLARDMDEAIRQAETATSSVTYGQLFADLLGAVETPAEGDIGRIDADAASIGTDLAFSIAAHWKKIYLDPEYKLLIYGRDDPSLIPVRGRHAFVVLGYQLQNGKMTAELKGRCDAAADAALAFPDSIIVCSGGATGSNNPEHRTEAGLMKQYLSEVRGIDPDRIFIDELAMTTAENAVNTFGILMEQNVETMTIVTSDYHQKWGQVLYNALAAVYRADHGYSAEIAGNYCFEIDPSQEMYHRGYRIALSQLGRILGLPREEMEMIR